ncbi:MAG: deoxyribonuclease IV [Dehalococcoidia bacterium]
MKRLQIGAHVSSSGGLWKAVERGLAIEAEALQIFPSAPQNWRPTNHTDEAYSKFATARTEAGLGEVWFHCIYLVNLATETPDQLEKSVAAVVNALTVADRAGGNGVVLHVGSHKGAGLDACLSQVAGALERIFEAAPGSAVLALENAAGHGGTIGRDFLELGAILKAVGNPRLQVCVDTCHAFAGGYNLADPDGVQAMLEEFDREVGLQHLAVWHLNDSKQGLGDQRDRHENIGDGRIGTDGFRVWLDAIRRVPEIPANALLLEVPGIENDGPDLENVRRMKAIREAVEGGG